MSRTAKADDYGRHELSIDTDIIALNEENPDWEDDLYRAGRALLKADGGGAFTLHTVWPSNRAPWALTDVWLGDIVKLDMTGTEAAKGFGNTVDIRLIDAAVNLERMPPRTGANTNPIYWVECNWDGIVRDLDITDGDPDQEVLLPEMAAATRIPNVAGDVMFPPQQPDVPNPSPMVNQP